MHRRIIYQDITLLLGIILSLIMCSTADVVAQSTPTLTVPTSSIALPENFFGENPRWLKLRVLSNGAITATVKIPNNNIEPLCSLHLEFASDPGFLNVVGGFSLGVTNFTYGTFSSRLGALPEDSAGKTIRRIFTRGILNCPPEPSVPNRSSTGLTLISNGQSVTLSKALTTKRTSLATFVKSFLLGKLRRSAYKSRSRFKLRPQPAPDQSQNTPLIKRQTRAITINLPQAHDLVAYAITAGTPPLNYSWHLVDKDGSNELNLTNQKGFRIINDSTGSMVIAFGDPVKLVGKSLRLTVRNNFGEVVSSLIPISAPTATPTASPAPTGTIRPTTSASPTSTLPPIPDQTQTATPPLSGLDSRPLNNTCLAPNRSSGSADFGIEQVFTNLAFTQPVKIGQAPGNSNRFYVGEQPGIIRSFQNNANVSTTQVFLDLRTKVTYQLQTGLMGFAFHPKWPNIPLVFVSYVGGNLESRLSSFTTTDGGNTLNSNSEQRILTVTQPNPRHTIGDIQFGSDGLLYVAEGDGANPPGDAGRYSQNPGSLLGKILRIDIDGVTGSANYRIPVTNPYAAGTLCGITNGASTLQPCAEIFALGFRNPWRFSVDPLTNGVWVGDVGQRAREEVNLVTAGGNYGWNCLEGTNPYVTACNQLPGSTPIPPVAQYTHDNGGFAITGGHVYRGNAIPSLTGRYLFGDYVTGNVWSIPLTTTPTTPITANEAVGTNLNIVSFGTDLNEELYLIDYSRGGIHKIVPPPTQSSGGVASVLSATGCVSPTDPTQPASGLVPFDPISPLWSDGSVKERWLALPDGSSITIASNGDFQFPRGTVLMKQFRLDSRLVETRLLMLHPDGVWAGYSYRWNDQQTEATLLSDGLTETVGGQNWTYPSSSQCMVCHTQAAGRSLGLELAQLNSDLYYLQTNRTANQLATMNLINLFNPPLSRDPATIPALMRPLGSRGTLAQRARSYLHANCSHCHQPTGGTPVNLDLRFSTTLPNTNICDQPPLAGNLGIKDARIIAPGAPLQSVLVSRMNRRDAFQMPPLGTHVVDDEGVRLLSDWIRSLANCN